MARPPTSTTDGRRRCLAAGAVPAAGKFGLELRNEGVDFALRHRRVGDDRDQRADRQLFLLSPDVAAHHPFDRALIGVGDLAGFDVDQFLADRDLRSFRFGPGNDFALRHGQAELGQGDRRDVGHRQTSSFTACRTTRCTAASTFSAFGT